MNLTKYTVFVKILLLLCAQVTAQTAAHVVEEPVYGEISGAVLDSETGLRLRDVNIRILGMNYGDASSEDGTFLIGAIPAGEYSLEVSRIGYHTRILRNVAVKPGRLTVRNVELEPTFVEFEDVILTATKTEQTAQMAPASVSVLRSDDIRQRNIATFDQALEMVPGITFQRTMGVSVQSLSLRGSSEVAGGGVGNRVLLAIDGRPALSSDSGGALWSLVPTNFIDRVEVVRGAYSSLYGSTAMGGVINVITKKPRNETHFRIDATGGLYELPPGSIRFKDSPNYFHTISLSHSRTLGKLAYLFSLSRKESDGHRQRSAYEFYNLYGKLFVDLANNRNLEVTLGGDIGRNDYPHTWLNNLEPLRVALKNHDNEQRKNTFSADVYYYAIPNPRVKYSSRFYFYRQYFKSEFNKDDPEQRIANNEPFGLFTRSHSRKIGNITQMDYYLSDQNYLIAGLDVQRDLIDSVPDTILYGKHQVNNFAIYAQDEHELSEKLTFNLGLRFDFNKLEGGKSLSQLSPKASLVYSPLQTWSIRFLVGRAFRAPSVSERFFQLEIAGGTEFEPNPDLDAEKVTSFEFGNRFRLGNTAEFDLALFHSKYDDMLYWINIAEERGIVNTLFQVRNLNRARLQGFESTVHFSPWQSLRLRLNYTYLDARDLSEDRTDDKLAYKVKHTFSFVTSFQTGPWFFNFDGRHNSKVEEVFLYPNDKPDAFFVLNGKLQRNFGKNLRMSLGINNIFDSQYEEMARYRMPGRTWILGTSYDF